MFGGQVKHFWKSTFSLADIRVIKLMVHNCQPIILINVFIYLISLLVALSELIQVVMLPSCIPVGPGLYPAKGTGYAENFRCSTPVFLNLFLNVAHYFLSWVLAAH
jgi:hypothetical protein